MYRGIKLSRACCQKAAAEYFKQETHIGLSSVVWGKCRRTATVSWKEFSSSPAVISQLSEPPLHLMNTNYLSTPCLVNISALKTLLGSFYAVLVQFITVCPLVVMSRFIGVLINILHIYHLSCFLTHILPLSPHLSSPLDLNISNCNKFPLSSSFSSSFQKSVTPERLCVHVCVHLRTFCLIQTHKSSASFHPRRMIRPRPHPPDAQPGPVEI